MGAHYKHTAEKIESAVKRYSKGESVRSLAKEYKISVPGLYNWIAKAREAAAKHADDARMSPATRALDTKINVELRVKALEQENDRLKRKLLDLLVKHGEL